MATKPHNKEPTMAQPTTSVMITNEVQFECKSSFETSHSVSKMVATYMDRNTIVTETDDDGHTLLICMERTLLDGSVENITIIGANVSRVH
jgi:hypothetical protein